MNFCSNVNVMGQSNINNLLIDVCMSHSKLSKTKVWRLIEINL